MTNPDHLSICQEANRQLRAEIAALKAATVRPNPADFASWSQETLAKFAEQVWDENKRLRAMLEESANEVCSLESQLAAVWYKRKAEGK